MTNYERTRPPKWPLTLLRFFVKKDYQEEIEGDMEELFQDYMSQFSRGRARKKYAVEVLKLIRPTLIKKLEGSKRLNNYGMLKNNVRIAIRSLLKQKKYTAINVLGLTVSMAISMLIIVFLIDQDSKDGHNPDANRTYRLITEFDDRANDRTIPYATSPYELKQLLSYNIEEVNEASQIIKTSGSLNYEDNLFDYHGLYVSPNFLSFFHFDLEKGDPTNALNRADQTVISSELANKLFPNEEPLGKLLKIDDLGAFLISGVIDSKIPKSHIEFDLLLPSQVFTAQQTNSVLLTDWDTGSKKFYNYFKLDVGANPVLLENFLHTLKTKFPEEKQALYNFSLQRLDKINLGRLIRNEIGTTTPEFVAYFFMVLALVLVLSSSFNYMNLSIARGLKRAKEVGVRKIIGAGKRQIVSQFLVEAQLVMFSSFVLGFLLLQVLIPVFNELKILRDIDGAITMNFNANLRVYLTFLSFTVLVGLVSGIYPALYLSSFKSLYALKGTNHTGKSHSFLFRKTLVFLQYSFSIIFIITAIMLYQQASIFANTNYGFSHANIINVPASNIPYQTFRDELLKRSEVQGVSAISNLPIISSFEEVSLTNKDIDKEENKSTILSIDPYLLDNLGIELIAGRNFNEGIKSDQNNKVIINQKALSALGYEYPESALNQTIDIISANRQGKETTKSQIIGIVKDFDFHFVFKESGPLIMNYDPSKLHVINIKVEGSSHAKAIEGIEGIWETFEKVHPFEYERYEYSIADIDDEFDELVMIIGVVAFIAIIIASLGQFSMVVHHVQLKVKEIGIRKVLGSDLSGLMFKLSKGFLFVIVAAVLVATPLAWKINVAWTSRIYASPEVSLLNMSVGVVIILFLAFLTIFFLVRKAVNANPVESLKYE